jgi:hypothetical protein
MNPSEEKPMKKTLDKFIYNAIYRFWSNCDGVDTASKKLATAIRSYALECWVPKDKTSTSGDESANAFASGGNEAISEMKRKIRGEV